MIAVVVPAHDEEALLPACLQSLSIAARSPHLEGEPVMVIVALDACSDGSATVAAEWGARTVELDARNVGRARALAAQHALDLGADWLAFTDADTQVAPDWLSAQRGLGADAVCGTVKVDDWETYGDRMRRHHEATYRDVDDHRHVHGANLGVSAAAYRAAGGFEALATGEDVALVDALERAGARLVWSAAPRVTTSARLAYRAPDGFGATLSRIHLQGAWMVPEGCA